MFGIKPRLRPILIMLSSGGILLSSIILLITLTYFQRENIQSDLLNANTAYAKKMSDVMGDYIAMAQGELSFSAQKITSMDDNARLKKEVNRLRLQSNLFNSVVIVNSQAMVVATSPETLALVGTRLKSETNALTLQSKKPFISHPFKSAIDNWLVLLTYPIFDNNGNYLGYINGTIYLQEKNIFNKILGTHYFNNQTDVSIVTKDGGILFNPNSIITGENKSLNYYFKNIINNKKDGNDSFHSGHQKYLLSYAVMPGTEWYIFVYSQTSNVTNILLQKINQIFIVIFVIISFFTVITSILASRIAKPLEELTLAASQYRYTPSRKLESLKNVNTWYYEIDYLKKALYRYLLLLTNRVNELNDESLRDPLTGAYNRRAFTLLTKNHINKNQYSIIAIDIDHFKKVNDSFGHAVGDQILVLTVNVLSNHCREEDLVCRFGGEEFIIFLPNTSLLIAEVIAERIRKKIEETHFLDTYYITISAGIASSEITSGNIDNLLQKADDALYLAKQGGRNRYVVAS